MVCCAVCVYASSKFQGGPRGRGLCPLHPSVCVCVSSSVRVYNVPPYLHVMSIVRHLVGWVTVLKVNTILPSTEYYVMDKDSFIAIES